MVKKKIWYCGACNKAEFFEVEDEMMPAMVNATIFRSHKEMCGDCQGQAKLVDLGEALLHIFDTKAAQAIVDLLETK